MTELFYAGNGERAKAACHTAMLGLAATFTLYNGVAWLLRKEPHLARNAVIYAGLTALEMIQIARHREALRKTT